MVFRLWIELNAFLIPAPADGRTDGVDQKKSDKFMEKIKHTNKKTLSVEYHAQAHEKNISRRDTY